MIIETWYWVLVMVITGLLAGSFAGAQVWRLRWAQVQADKKAGEKYDRKEHKRLKVLQTKAKEHDRSKCLSCGKQLAWYDLLPLASWISTKGKCRYCNEPIGWFEPLMEASLATAFVLSYFAWPFALQTWLDVSLFIVWLLTLVVASILFAYDLKWSLLPDSMNYGLIALGAVFAVIAIVLGNSSLLSVLGSVALFAGVYGGLYYISYFRNGEENTWVGFGDVKLSIALGLLLGSWQLSFLALFLANLLGTLIVLPWLLRGKLDRKAHIPFGPLLLVGTFIALLYGGPLISWYFGLFFL